MLKPDIYSLQQLETLEITLKDIFKKFDFIEISLTVDEIPCILFKCEWCDASLEHRFKIDDNKYMLVDDDKHIIQFSDIWRHLFCSAMDKYQLALTRLYKKIDKE